MRKASKFIAVLLAALMLMTSTAFAADGSKQEPSVQKNVKAKHNIYTLYNKTKTATMTGAQKHSYKYKTKVVSKTITIKGKKYTVTKIAKNAFAKCKKLKVVKVYCTKAPKVQKNPFGKLNTKKITVKVTKKMSKKEFNKFKKYLRKAGFKGKIKRVKI